MMKQSTIITDTGLWFVHIGLFQSRISQILEGRIWVSPHSLLLVLVAAPYAFITASNNVQQDCAPAYILDSETRNQPEHLVSQHSVFSSAWSNNVSQVSPDRDQNSHFGEDAFITQNQIFYRKQYEQVFKFSDPYPTNQIIRNNIDGGDVLSQQYLQRIIAESSVTAARKLHGPSRRTLVNDSWRQIYSGPYKCYRQRCPDSNSTSYQKEESTTAAPDHELN